MIRGKSSVEQVAKSSKTNEVQALNTVDMFDWVAVSVSRP